MGIPCPKPLPSKLAREAKRSRIKADDEAENKIVRKRSGGRCEVIELHPNPWDPRRSFTAKRCERRAVHIHHMIGGWGKRARGKSKLAEFKQHACVECHSDITGHVLRREGGNEPHYKDFYHRITAAARRRAQE